MRTNKLLDPSTICPSGRTRCQSASHGVACLSILLALTIAEWASSQTFTVTETAGLRRFGYPVTASIELSQGAVKSIDKLRLLNANGQEVAAQFTALSHSSDGSIRACDVDFTTGLGPQESQTFHVEAGVGPRQALPKGIAVKEEDDSILIVSPYIQHRIRRDGKPLLDSITFGKEEFLAMDGVSISTQTSEAKIIKRGPFNVTIDMGKVRLEYVSSKSWVKLTQRAEAMDTLSVDGHFHLSADTLTWDLGIGSWLYGTTQGPQDIVQLRKESSLWQVVTTKKDKQPSLFATSPLFDGCGHFADPQRVAAFGIADCSSLDEAQVQLRGDGRIRLSAKCRTLSVYFHFVGQPTQVTAVTSPQSMVAPLQVTVMPIP
ncbi:MAG: hypothetical protein IT423_02005 [Pirellulaceae bacterium]|nr:hypothetical protein [Pirellulaceae bacterium]